MPRPTAIAEILMTHPEDIYLGLGSRVLYFSHQGNWHVRVKVCEGYSKIVYDGDNYIHALTCLYNLDKSGSSIPFEINAEGPSPSA
jgi:hypothetical protein